jgi:prepilin-type N-terminal cleavage/methylation domain-containing protein
MRGQSVDQFRDPGPRARAFTLIEVLIVVLILGIASAVILPQVNGQDDTNAAAAARTVMGDLLYAQNRAIAMQTMQYVSFDVPHQQYGLYGSMSPQSLLQHPVNLNNYVMTFAKSGPNNIAQNVVLTSAGFNGQDTIAFDETGVPYSYNAGSGTTLLNGIGAIQLTSGNYSVTISVAQDTGEITVN